MICFLCVGIVGLCAEMCFHCQLMSRNVISTNCCWLIKFRVHSRLSHFGVFKHKFHSKRKKFFGFIFVNLFVCHSRHPQFSDSITLMFCFLYIYNPVCKFSIILFFFICTMHEYIVHCTVGWSVEFFFDRTEQVN